MARKNKNGDDLAERHHELKGKFRKLQKENKILRRELERWAGWMPEDDHEEAVIPERKRKPRCPRCESEIAVITAGIYTIKSCQSCDWRKRTTEE